MAAIAFLFSLNGTASRRAALAVWLLAALAQIGVAVMLQSQPVQARVYFPAVALTGVVLLAVSARRLHHAGHTGRWAALTLLPYLGLIAGLVIALLPPRRVRLWANTGARALGYGAMVLLVLIGFWRVTWTGYPIVSEDMKPTLLVGDFLLVQMGAEVTRGDVVALRRAGDGAVVFKRVIGMGGDKVALDGGQVLLNGAVLPQLPQGDFAEVMAPQGPLGLRPRCANGLVGDGAECRKSRLSELLPDGRAYDILNIEAGNVGDSLAEVAVPSGALFVLGDNRDDSLDSRFDQGVGGLGMVAQADVLGVVRRVVISLEGRSRLAVWTLRLGRIWQAVN